MAEAKTAVANKPAWVDLSTSDAPAAREFYSKLFGWKVEVNPDPQYGGYGMANVGGKQVAGIGPQMSPEAPTAWSVYIGTDDADDLAKKVQTAGGKVIAPPFDVGDQGRMAVFQDPTGAFISAWQPRAMNAGLPSGEPGTFATAFLWFRVLTGHPIGLGLPHLPAGLTSFFPAILLIGVLGSVLVIPMLAAPHQQTVHAPDAQSTGRRSPPGWRARISLVRGCKRTL